ncbi:MAG: hypothetical protein JWO67_5963 [Streptosporangiaceae bacterium]|jgi:hypothetical protein|nr:hypothetical protein [Streptosporangiaceae bacterium]
MTTTATTIGAVPARAGAAQSPGVPLRRQPRGSSVTLTGRGGMVVLFGLALLGTLLGSESLLGIGMLPGLAFVLGCVLAAVATRPSDLLAVAVSPPLIFFIVALIGSLVDATGGGSAVQSFFVGVVTVLASNAPWLFLGTALLLAIMIPRGLLANLRELRTRLAGQHAEDHYDDDPVRWDE